MSSCVGSIPTTPTKPNQIKLGIKMTDEIIRIEELENDGDKVEIAYFGGNGYKVIVKPYIIGNGRWELAWESIILFEPDNTYWQCWWTTGATEYQDVDYDFSMCQVWPKEVTTIQYDTQP